jgi:hypothetical protein
MPNIVDQLIDALMDDAVDDAWRSGSPPVSEVADEIIRSSGCSLERWHSLIHRLALDGIKRRLIIEFRGTQQDRA